MMADLATLLPPNSTPLERAIEAIHAPHWEDIDGEELKAAMDPWRCPAHLLPFLAHQRSVDIWDEDWPEWKKRSVIASAPADHRLKGTEAGLRRALAIVDADLDQLVVPPQHFVIGNPLTKAQKDELVARHPRLRIVLTRRSGTYRPPAGLVTSHSFAGHAALVASEAWKLLGRRARLSQNGVESEITVEPIRLDGQRAERVALPGRARRALAIGKDALGHSAIGAHAMPPRIFTFALDPNYRHETTALELGLVSAGLLPRSPNFRRESERGQLRRALALGASALGLARPGYSDASDLIADVLHLIDPAVPVPQIQGRSFLGTARLSMPHHVAEALIDWRDKVRPKTFTIAGRWVLGQRPLQATDPARRRLILSAIARMSRLSDRVRVTFQTHRSRRLSDGIPLDPGVEFGALVPNRL